MSLCVSFDVIYFSVIDYMIFCLSGVPYYSDNEWNKLKI